VEKRCRDAGFRVSSDLSDDRMNLKIRNAQNMKVPYMVIVGQREMEGKQVSVRYRNGKQANGLDLGVFLAEVKEKVDSKQQL
jgi:threonyl-tRNA synthetase